MGVSVQVSFYALGGADINAAVKAFVSVLGEHGLTYEVGSMSTVIWGELEEILVALRDAYEQASLGNATVMNITVSNVCPAP